MSGITDGGAAAGAGAGGTGAGAQGAGAAGGQTGQANGAGAAGGAGAGGQGAGAPATDWTTGLTDTHKGFIGLKGWKNAGDMVESYQGMEKFVGTPQERLISIPKDEDAEGWGKVYNRLGRPEKPEGYKIGAPEKGDPEFAKWAQGTFHELGLTGKQAEKLVGKWGEYVEGISQKQTQGLEGKVTQDAQALKQEWGAAYEQNSAIVDKAAREFGIGEQQLLALRSALGAAGAMKMLHNIGSRLGEDSFVSGQGGGNNQRVLSPVEAKVRIAQLKQDESFVSKYLAGGAEEKKEMDRLHSFLV